MVCRESSGMIGFDDFFTRPSAHPLCYLICYMLKSGDTIVCRLPDLPQRTNTRIAARFVSAPCRADDDFFTDAVNQLYAEGKTGTSGHSQAISGKAISAGQNTRRFPAATNRRIECANHLFARPHGRRHIRLLPGDALSRSGAIRTRPVYSCMHVQPFLSHAGRAVLCERWIIRGNGK